MTLVKKKVTVSDLKVGDVIADWWATDAIPVRTVTEVYQITDAGPNAGYVRVVTDPEWATVGVFPPDTPICLAVEKGVTIELDPDDGPEDHIEADLMEPPELDEDVAEWTEEEAPEALEPDGPDYAVELLKDDLRTVNLYMRRGLERKQELEAKIKADLSELRSVDNQLSRLTAKAESYLSALSILEPEADDEPESRNYGSETTPV